MKLSENQIKFGYFHGREDKTKSVVELSEYNGEEELVINCTQLGDSFTPQYKTAKEKKRVLQEWCEFLINNPTAFTRLTFGTRVPQELFNAACHQKNLQELHIKWGVYPDISAVANLSELEYLHIGSGAGVQSIEGLCSLEKLLVLTIENFQKIEDYSGLKHLTQLETLYISGDSWAPKNIHINDLEFLKEMTQLRSFSLFSTQVRNKDISPILSLVNVEFLSLMTSKEVKALYLEIIKLPKLKYGLLKEKPELYME